MYLFLHTQRNLIREATAFLLDVLKPNLPEHAFLQTKVETSCQNLCVSMLSLFHLLSSKFVYQLSIQVLEINLVTFPNVAEAILAGSMFSHYDRPRVAQLCEKAGLYIQSLKVGSPCLSFVSWLSRIIFPSPTPFTF